MSAPSVNDALFGEAVSGLFRGWTALQLAVNYGFGGAYCEEKAKWLVYATETWFNENSNVDPYECEEFLEDVVNYEFDLIVDDGSLSEIARKICDFYKLCKERRYDEIKEEITKFPVAQVQNCQKVDDECEDDKEIEDDSSQPSTSQPSSLLFNQTTSHSHPESQPEFNQHVNNSEKAMETDEDDGWTVVRKGGKNK